MRSTTHQKIQLCNAIFLFASFRSVPDQSKAVRGKRWTLAFICYTQRNRGPPNHLCPINLYIFYLLSSGYTDVWPPSYLNIHPLSSAFGKSHEVSPYTTGMRRQNASSFAQKKVFLTADDNSKFLKNLFPIKF